MKYLLLLSLAAILTGCMEPTPEETKPEDAQALVNSMVYVKSKVGICYGVVTVSRVSSGGGLAINQMLVTVDCAKVGL